jgi:hypothetical protein
VSDREALAAILKKGDYVIGNYPGVIDKIALQAADDVIAEGWVWVDPNEPHLINFGSEGWIIQHPLTCRPNLFNCPYNVAAHTTEPDDIEGGTYKCDLDGETLLVLERMD